MLHGITSITANFRNKDPINYFFDELRRYIGRNGTILVPSFTYSFCRKKYLMFKKLKVK